MAHDDPTDTEVLDDPTDAPDADGTAEPATLSEREAKERDRKMWRKAKAGAQGEPETKDDTDEVDALEDEDAIEEPSEGAKPKARDKDDESGVARRQLEATARGVFTRAGLRPRLIDHLLNLPSDELHSELKQSVANLRTQQRHADQLGNEAAELRRKAAQPETKSEPKKTARDKMIAAIQARMKAGTATEEDADLLPDLLAEAPAPESKDDRNQREAPKTEDDHLREFRDVLDGMQADYPPLKGEAGRRSLVRTAMRMSEDGAFNTSQTIYDVFEAAAGVLFAAKDPRRAQRDRDKQNRIEREGQPTPDRRSSPNAGRKVDERAIDKKALRLLGQGRSPQAVQRWKQSQLTG